MIRGINRQIIDVPDTGSVYYERAYLVVKPEFASAEHDLLAREARKVLKGMDAPEPGLWRCAPTRFRCFSGKIPPLFPCFHGKIIEISCFYSLFPHSCGIMVPQR